MELAVLALSFTLLLVLGVPVAFSIGLASVATILAAGLPVAVVFQKMVGGMQIFSFLAIPFFVFAGELMLYGGVADRIVRFANSLVGHVRGGLGMSNVLGCTLFGGVAGSPLADVSAMGSVMIPLMKKEGYDADYAVNVTTHAALVGALMPTSHNLIIFTLATSGIASVSVLSLILAGLVPALLLTLCNLAAAYFVAVKRGFQRARELPRLRDEPVALQYSVIDGGIRVRVCGKRPVKRLECGRTVGLMPIRLQQGVVLTVGQRYLFSVMERDDGMSDVRVREHRMNVVRHVPQTARQGQQPLTFFIEDVLLLVIGAFDGEPVGRESAVRVHPCPHRRERDNQQFGCKPRPGFGGLREQNLHLLTARVHRVVPLILVVVQAGVVPDSVRKLTEFVPKRECLEQPFRSL